MMRALKVRSRILHEIQYEPVKTMQDRGLSD